MRQKINTTSTIKTITKTNKQNNKKRQSCWHENKNMEEKERRNMKKAITHCQYT